MRLFPFTVTRSEAPAVRHQLAVILSEARSAQSKDPEYVRLSLAARPFLTLAFASIRTAVCIRHAPATRSEAPAVRHQLAVILSEARSAQSKDPEYVRPSLAARPFLTLAFASIRTAVCIRHAPATLSEASAVRHQLAIILSEAQRNRRTFFLPAAPQPLALLHPLS